jgi:hypothetical protein
MNDRSRDRFDLDEFLHPAQAFEHPFRLVDHPDLRPKPPGSKLSTEKE